MIIQSSNVDFSSSRSYRVRQSNITAISIWGQKPKEDVAKDLMGKKEMGFDDILSKFQKEKCVSEIKSPSIVDKKTNSKFQMLDYLWKLLFSKNDIGKNFYEYMNQQQVQEFGGEAVTLYYHEETEQTTFQAKGNVKTADGKVIDFNMDVTMTRSFMEYAETKIQFGAPNMIFCDPLVLNFGKNVGEISDQKILFDLDSDGIKDEISTTSGSSGFLSLDQNGWIDENDPIYEKLKIFFCRPDGTKDLVSLKKMDVGAICLQNVDTEFSLKNQKTQEDLGRIRKTGIFLYESGQAGSIQHIDLVKKTSM